MDTTPDMSQLREQYSYYAKRLLSDLGLGDLGQPERGQLLASIEAYVQQIMFYTILQNLDQENLTKANKMMGEGVDETEVMARLLGSLPDLPMKLADSLALAYAQMLDEARQLSQALIKKEQPAAQ